MMVKCNDSQICEFESEKKSRLTCYSKHNDFVRLEGSAANIKSIQNSNNSRTTS